VSLDESGQPKKRPKASDSPAMPPNAPKSRQSHKAPEPPPPSAPLLPLVTQAYACGYNFRESGSILLLLVHRSIARVETCIANPFRHLLLGTPLLLRVPRTCTRRELYSMVSRRCAHVLKREAAQEAARCSETGSGLAKLAPPVPPTEEDSKGGSVSWEGPAAAPLSSQDAHSGPVPPLGFRLREVTPDGVGDPRAHWLSRSTGRTLPADSEALDLADGCCVAIDWHLAVVKAWFETQARSVLVHPSLGADSGAGLGDQTLSLSACLDTFVKEEKMKEAYCSKCKEHRDATLKTEIWRLPPVLVVHLKRFHFTQYSRRKLHNLVKFPVDDLDMSKYMAKETAEPTDAEGAEGKGDGGEGGGFLSVEDGRSVGNYELYAVVHHLGAMSAGHYVSSVKCRATGQWHCFNDNVLVPTTEKELISESAYLLFYVRKDMAGVALDEVYPSMPNKGNGSVCGGQMDDEEVARMMKKRDRACSLM